MSRDSDFINAMNNLTEVRDPIFRQAFRRAMLAAGGDFGFPQADLTADVFEAENKRVRDAGCGELNIRPTGIVTLTEPLVIDAGSGVGGWFSGAIIDARGLAGVGGSAITLMSRAPTTQPVSGLDASTSNYWQFRNRIGGFVLLLPDDMDGIDINMDPASATRNVRALLSHFVIKGGRYGIRHRNYAYLCFIEKFAIYNQTDACIAMEGGSDKGENSGFKDGALFNTPLGLLVDTVPETGSAVGTYFTMDNVSFDYLGKHVEFASGYGACRMTNCHHEWNSANATYPFDFGTAANNTMIWDIRGPNILHTGATQNFPAVMQVGTNHNVSVDGAFLHDLLGAGVAGKTMIADVTSGKFEMSGSRFLSSTVLPRHASNSTDRNWVADGTFAQSALVDAWYANGDANFSAPTKAASGGNLTAGCLSVPIVNGASLTRNLCLLVPVRGKQFSVSLMAKLTGGSGTIELKWGACVVHAAITPGTKPTIALDGATTQIDSKTLNTSTFTEVGLTSNVPRLALPDWATHVKILISGFNLNAATFNLLIDEVRIDSW